MAEENVEVTEELTPEGETQADTQEPTTDQLISDDLDKLYDEAQETEEPVEDSDDVSEEAEAVDEDVEDSSEEEKEEKPKVVLTRREKEALKHAGMEETVDGMEPSAV